MEIEKGRVEIHPFDLYDKLIHLSKEELAQQNRSDVVIDGILYVEKIGLPYDLEAARRNGLVR